MPKRYQYRTIQGLKWAQLALEGPRKNLRPKRLRGCRAAGIAYERKLGKYLRRLLDLGRISGELHSGQWLHFEDHAGPGYAQPDHFVVGPRSLVLLECKLSQVSVAWPQMRELYAPLLEEIYGRPVQCVLVCKNLREPPSRLARGYQDLADGATWHWLGHELI